jgi:pimeloyl-ACP methyl ester carboxylesterase
MTRRPLLAAVSALALGFTTPIAVAPPLAHAQPAAQIAADRTAELRSETRERWAALGFETRVLRLNGVDIHVAIGGQGPPVVLLHGYPQSGEIWRGIAPALARSHQVIVPDLRGMGLSSTDASDHRLMAAAEDLRALLQALGIPLAQIVGHDWGGAVGATLALAHPDTVTRLVFIESALAGAGFEELWRFDRPNPGLTFIPFLLMDGLAEQLVAGREEQWLRHLWSGSTGDRAALPFDAWRPYLDAMRRPGLFASAAGYYRSAYVSAEDTRRLLAAGKLTIPVFAVAGERSFGAAHGAVVRNFAGNVVRNVVLAGAGHFVPEERPAELHAELDAFLTR